MSETSLARAVSEIRNALGGRRGRVVRTVHGYGYAFAGEVDEEAPSRTVAAPSQVPVCWLTSASRHIPLADGTQIAGRVTLEPGAQIRIGPFTFVFRVEVAPASTETEAAALLPRVVR